MRAAYLLAFLLVSAASAQTPTPLDTVWTAQGFADAFQGTVQRRLTDPQGRPVLLTQYYNGYSAYGTPPQPVTRLQRWTGVEWEHLDVYDPALVAERGATSAAMMQVNSLAFGPGDTLFVATARGIFKRTATTWKMLPGFMNDAKGIAFDAQGRLLAWGNTISSVYANATYNTAFRATTKGLARFDNGAWSSPTMDEGVSGITHFLPDGQGGFYAFGPFKTAGGTRVLNLKTYQYDTTPAVTVDGAAHWTGSAWEAVGDGLDGVTAAALDAGGTLYVGGSFQTAGPPPSPYYPRPRAVKFAARLAGGVWEEVGGGLPGSVVALAFSPEGVLHAGVVNTRGLYAFDGAAWNVVGGGVGDHNYAYSSRGAYSVSFQPGEVCAAGPFSGAGGDYTVGNTYPTALPGYGCWNGTRWQFPRRGLDAAPVAMAVDAQGRVYAIGPIGQAGMQAASGFVILEKMQWRVIPAPLTGNDAALLSIAVDAQGRVYVGGRFDTIGGVDSPNLALWDGTAWQAVGQGVWGDYLTSKWAFVHTIVIDGQGRVLVGGQMAGAKNADGTGVSGGVARWDGTAWTALPGLTAVRGLGIAPDGTLYAVGHFLKSGNVDVGGVARWDGLAWQNMDGGMDMSLTTNNTLFVRSVSFGPGDEPCIAGTVPRTDRYVETPEGLACWNGSAWYRPDGGIPENAPPLVLGKMAAAAEGVTALARDPAGRLLVALPTRVVRWDGQAWATLATPGLAGVGVMAVGDGRLWMAGSGGAIGQTVVGTPDYQLPVELTSFAATLAGADVMLRWATASETNNAGWGVEMKKGAAWAEIAFVGGAGTTAEAHQYTRAVPGLAAGHHAFRLRQTDFDGATTYSATVEVDVAAGGLALALVGAHPARGDVRFAVTTPFAQPVRLAVYDALGREVAVLVDADVSGHAEAVLPGLASGLYVARLVAGAQTITRTFVVAR